MTTPDDALPEGVRPDGPRPDGALPDDALVDGFTLDELGDYLDRGRSPRDARIEGSAAARHALLALEQVSELSWESLEREAGRDPHRDDAWIAGLLGRLSHELVDGRPVPVHSGDPSTVLELTEASVRGLVRRAGDAGAGVVVTATELDGDVSTPEAPVTVRVTVAARYGLDLHALARDLRERVLAVLRVHTELVVDAVDVTIDDLLPPGTPDAPGDGADDVPGGGAR